MIGKGIITFTTFFKLDSNHREVFIKSNYLQEASSLSNYINDNLHEKAHNIGFNYIM